MYKYFPHTNADIAEMLADIGCKDIKDLFSEISKDLFINGEVNIPQSHSETELREEVQKLGKKNKTLVSFLGAGSYDVFNLSIINYLASRQEFLTSYTPYQPEISQGTLQYIFEWQSIICELTGMDVSNASMYDGATATAEAMLMAYGHTKKKKVLLSNTVNPRVCEVVKTYAKFKGLEVIEIKSEGYVTSFGDFKEKIDDDVSCFIAMQPNYYGALEDYHEFSSLLQANKTIFILNMDPSTLPLLKNQSMQGADIACGEAQSLGLPLANGGPYLGYLATKNALMRKLPGRICGMTKDVDGRKAYVLTLQAREQHIRREKANSNICSNQSLMALETLIYMCAMGKRGLKEVAKRAYDNTHYLCEELVKTGLFKYAYEEPFFKECVLKYQGNSLDGLLKKWLQKGFLGGVIIKENYLLICATEKRTKEEIDTFVKIVGEDDV